jgi:F-type H+-transporting ATPase subunit delta
MAENATVARPYAEALFRVAQAGKESFNLAAWSELVAELAQIGAHPEVQALPATRKRRPAISSPPSRPW